MANANLRPLRSGESSNGAGYALPGALPGRGAPYSGAMAEHPDVLVGTTPAGDGSIEVLVSGVDVRLTIRRQENNLALFLSPDEAINLREMLDAALRV